MPPIWWSALIVGTAVAVASLMSVPGPLQREAPAAEFCNPNTRVKPSRLRGRNDSNPSPVTGASDPIDDLGQLLP